MKYAEVAENQWFIRLVKDEEIIEQLTLFCQEKQIEAGYIQGIGGLQKARVGVYRLGGSKEYEFQKFSGDLELVSLQGNVSKSVDATMLHLHAVVGDDELQVIGGHLDSGIVGGTVEIHVTRFNTHFERVYDGEIGLKLLEFPQ